MINHSKEVKFDKFYNQFFFGRKIKVYAFDSLKFVCFVRRFFSFTLNSSIVALICSSLLEAVFCHKILEIRFLAFKSDFLEKKFGDFQEEKYFSCQIHFFFVIIIVSSIK